MVNQQSNILLFLVSVTAIAMSSGQVGGVPHDAMEPYGAVQGFPQGLASARLDGTTASGEAEQVPAPANPLPFDPLSPEEQRRAIALALENGTVAASPRVQVIGAALYTDKSFQELETWPRMAEVWVYDYTTDRTLRSFVDLRDDAVLSVEALGFQPPLVADEVHRAGKLALDDDRTLERLADVGAPTAGLGWNARLWHDPEGPVTCTEHRCVLVAMLDGSRFVLDPLVLVDLSAQEVVGLMDRDYQWIGGASP